MKLEFYDKTKKIPENFFKTIIDSQVECWGVKPFGEFLICSNINCGKIHSIEDVYGTINNYRNRKIDIKYKCICGGNTDFFYEKENFLNQLIEYINLKIDIVLLIEDNNNVLGGGILRQSSIKSIIDLEFSTRPGSYDKDLLLKILSNKVFGLNDAKEKEVMIFHQIYILNHLRKNGYSKQILDYLFQILGKRGLPVIAEAKGNGDGYVFANGMGFEPIFYDKHGYFVMVHNNPNFFQENNTDEIISRIKNNSLTKIT